MGCATKCVAFSVLIFNFVFAIVGIIIVIVGVLLQLNIINYTLPAGLIHDPLEVIPIVIIVIGGTIVVVSLFGCFGVGKGNTKLLITYIIILVILFVLQLCFGFYIIFNTNCEPGLQNTIDSEFKKLIDDYSKSADDKLRVDILQQQFQCCGVTNATDWTTLPTSCCEENKNCFAGSPELFGRGCTKVMLDYLMEATSLIYILSFGATIFHVLGIFLSGILLISIKNDIRRTDY